MKNLYNIFLGLFVLCTFTAVNANCNLKSFSVDTAFPLDVSEYSLSVNNRGEYNVLVVPGNTWGFLVDSSLAEPKLSVTIDEQKRTINMVVDEFNSNFVKTAGSNRMAPSLMVLLSGFALSFFGKDKKALLLLGIFLCFAATSVMAFDACNTIIITYPMEMSTSECVNCEAPNRATRDTNTQCIVPATPAPATSAPAPATSAPATAAPSKGTATAAPAPATAAPATAAPAPATSAPATAAPSKAPATAAPAPATAAPATAAPATAAPATAAPATAAPATAAPATAAPATAAPATSAPVTTPTTPITSSGTNTPLTCTNYIQPAPSQYYNNVHMCTTNHLPYSLSLSSDIATLEQQVDQIMALSSYNDPTVYSPDPSTSFANYQASFYPSSRLYANNPTQTLIGLSDITFTMNVMSTKLRLPSIYFGMFLAYDMDTYGINPHFLLGQAGKEAAATMVSPTFNQNFFTCDNTQIASGGCSGKVYDCRATYNVGDPNIQGVTHQGCPAVDNFGIALGPFQIETEGFAQVASIAPQRFWVETATRTAANTPVKTPFYMDSGSLALQATNIKAMQANYTSHNSDSLAIIGAGIYHHWVHNLLIQFPLLNFRSAFDARNTAQQNELTFATILYLYNRGMYSPLDFTNCPATADPTSSPNCVTSLGFGNYAAQIKNATYSLDHAPNVYDFPIQWADVEFFIGQLELSYPYQCASCDFGGAYGSIDWDDLYCEAYIIFEKLAAARALKYNAQVATGISFRYDWRLMMAVIRSFLPNRDEISGPDFAPWTARAGSNGVLNLATDPAPAAAPLGNPSWIATAGTRKTNMNSCAATMCPGSSTATSAPSNTATSAPSNTATSAPSNTATSAPGSAATSAPAGNSAKCTKDGTTCTADCATTYYQCSGGTAYPVQNVAAGTLCYQGTFILKADSRCAGH